MDGIRAKLRQGYWCGSAPVGYKWDKNIGMLVIDEKKGPLVRKAFMMKYKDPNVTSEEIRRKIRKMGLNIARNTMSRLLRNPIYCGLIAHNALKGDLVEAKHEAIISKKVFLAVNNALAEKNARGWQVNEEEINLPLKRFMRCDCCGTPLTGYIVRKKGIYYYKCRKKGCGVNKNAKKMGELFMEEIRQFGVQEEIIPFVVQQVKASIVEANKAAIKEAETMERRLVEIDKKLKRLRERFVLHEEITREEYKEFAGQLTAEKEEILTQIEKSRKNSSNLLDHVEDCVKLGANLGVLWENGNYRDKQRIQKIAFPEGMFYDKKNDRVRTPRVNSIFALSSQISEILAQKNEGGSGCKTASSHPAHP